MRNVFRNSDLHEENMWTNLICSSRLSFDKLLVNYIWHTFKYCSLRCNIIDALSLLPINAIITFNNFFFLPFYIEVIITKFAWWLSNQFLSTKSQVNICCLSINQHTRHNEIWLVSSGMLGALAQRSARIVYGCIAIVSAIERQGMIVFLRQKLKAYSCRFSFFIFIFCILEMVTFW